MQNESNKPLVSYKGVCYDKLKGRWKGRTLVNGKRVSAGYHDTAEQAYEAVQQVQRQAAEDEAQRQAGLPMRWLLRTEDIPVSAKELPVPDNYQDIVARAQRTKTVIQHNKLAEIPTTATLLEARIFCLMLRTIRKGDTEAPTAVIPIDELFSTFGGHQHQLLEAAMGRMMSATIRIPEPNKEDVHLISLCDSMRYDSATKMLVATFGKAVTPYLINLAGNFAVADVDELLAISSNSTYRLYWLMRKGQYMSPYTIGVDQLRLILTSDNEHYNEYSDFRRKVLNPSVAELNGLSFDITYTETRQGGRAVTSITFTINRKIKGEQLTLPLATELEAATVLLSSLQQKVQTRLQKLKLTDAQIWKVQQVLAGDEKQLKKLMQETHPILINLETKAKPGENVAAATVEVLKNIFPGVWRAK